MNIFYLIVLILLVLALISILSDTPKTRISNNYKGCIEPINKKPIPKPPKQNNDKILKQKSKNKLTN